MSQFYQVFFDESEEHLAAIEAILLRIDPAAPPAEGIAEIFRAAHSIKGSAATFGFDDMATLTHAMENLLDRVRKGELALQRGMVEAVLAACDVLRAQLDAHRGSAGAADPQAAAVALARLQACGEVPAAPPPQGGHGDGLELNFVLSRVVAGSEVLIDSLFDALGELGEVRTLSRPPADAADGVWTLALRGCAAEERVRAALDLFVEPGTLEIAALAAPCAAAAMQPLPGEEIAADGSYGFFLPPPQPAVLDDVPPVSPPASPPVAAEEGGRERMGTGNSIRVGVDKVDQMINLVGELVITRSILQEAANVVDPALAERLLAGLGLLERNTRELQESVMAIRMVPISRVFSRFPRLVRELADSLGKEVELVLAGEHTELDKSVVERVADPLTHLVRNALDHGLEGPQERLAAGKAARGRLSLSARHEGGQIVIEVADDGRGLDRQRVLARARASALPVDEGMSDAELWQLLFLPGFSTAESVSALSGRGVGMDVVRHNVDALGGSIELDSVDGVGTRVVVRLPLTLAIMDGMTVAVGRETYVLPLAQIVESLQVDAEAVHRIGGVARMIRVRGEYLPVVALGERFAVPGAERDWLRAIMVLVEAGGRRAALMVDALLGQQQVVIKSLETHYRRVHGFSAATILGNGEVALIVDVGALVDASRVQAELAA